MQLFVFLFYGYAIRTGAGYYYLLMVMYGGVLGSVSIRGRKSPPGSKRLPWWVWVEVYGFGRENYEKWSYFDLFGPLIETEAGHKYPLSIG